MSIAAPQTELERLAAAIRCKRWPSDEEFDRCMAQAQQAVSSRYWSQLAVAARAAEWFEEHGVKRVLDIGSGAGKFCVAAALAGRCSFVGVEQRVSLVEASRTLAHAFGVDDRVRFEHAAFGQTQLPAADLYYLYNPFSENLFGYRDHLADDDEVELCTARYIDDVSAVEDLLRAAPVGMLLLTYNGFGGSVPSSYSEIATDLNLPCPLRLWRKMTLQEHGEHHYSDTL